jgi:hypothetical protein
MYKRDVRRLKMEVKFDIKEIKAIEDILYKKNIPSMKWQIDDQHALCWDASMNKLTFYEENLYMILQFAKKKQREYFDRHMDEFLQRIEVTP